MTIRPWMAALTFCFLAVATIGYLAATSYLVIRDDLIGATMARQARMQHDYEDRIAALRAQLDRITSRQLLDQQVVEQKVEKLMQQQTALFSRHGKLGSLLDRAEESGVKPTDAPGGSGDFSTHAFQSTSGDHASAGGTQAIDKLLAGSQPAQPTDSVSALGYVSPSRENLADRADRIFSKVTLSLKGIEKEQIDKINKLTDGASETADAMAAIMRRTGVDVASANQKQAGGIGGPFVEPVTNQNRFDESLDGLDAALSRLETVRATARDLPFGNPAPGHGVTSPFGNRIDPFLGRLALHSGIDFQADTGDGIRSTGTGTVTIAGPVNGYGNMVEIDHGQGISTRYGHMSRILVKEGDTVQAGDIIGRAGATGRATGPHVHYEVRRNGEPIDPVHFLNAGMKLTTLMN